MIAKALSDFGLTNVAAEKYSLVEVLLISNVNYTDRILEPNEYPLNVLRQQRKVRETLNWRGAKDFHSNLLLGICS